MAKLYQHLAAVFLCLCIALAAQSVQASSVTQAHEEQGRSPLLTADDDNAGGSTCALPLNYHALLGDDFVDCKHDEHSTRQDDDHPLPHSRADGIYPKPFFERPEIIPDAADQCRPGNDLGCRNDNRRFFGANPAVTPVPVPASLLLIGSGMTGLLGLRERRQ